MTNLYELIKSKKRDSYNEIAEAFVDFLKTHYPFDALRENFSEIAYEFAGDIVSGNFDHGEEHEQSLAQDEVYEFLDYYQDDLELLIE